MHDWQGRHLETSHKKIESRCELFLGNQSEPLDTQRLFGFEEKTHAYAGGKQETPLRVNRWTGCKKNMDEIKAARKAAEIRRELSCRCRLLRALLRVLVPAGYL